MTDKEKIIKLKEIITNQYTYTKEEIIDELYFFTFEDIKDSMIEWNEVLNNIKEIIYHD